MDILIYGGVLGTGIMDGTKYMVQHSICLIKEA